MMNCKEVAHLLASDALADAVWSDRALVQLHLMMCRHCKGYAEQLRAIGDAARERYDLVDADSATFELLQNSILERCLEESEAHGEGSGDPDPEAPPEHTDPR